MACPITGIVISDAVEMTGYTKVVMSGTTNLFYTRDNSQFPVSSNIWILSVMLMLLIAFKLTESNYCIFDGQDNITPGRMDYVLSNVLRSACIRNVILL